MDDREKTPSTKTPGLVDADWLRIVGLAAYAIIVGSLAP